MVSDVVLVGIAFGFGVIDTLVVLLLGYGLGRKSRGLEPGVGEVIQDFRSDKYSPLDEVDETEELNDDYFSRAQLAPGEGGHKFPSDEELALINRHNNE